MGGEPDAQSAFVAIYGEEALATAQAEREAAEKAWQDRMTAAPKEFRGGGPPPTLGRGAPEAPFRFIFTTP